MSLIGDIHNQSLPVYHFTQNLHSSIIDRLEEYGWEKCTLVMAYSHLQRVSAFLKESIRNF